MIQLNTSVSSDVGRNRTQNEDSYLLDEEKRVYIVCDGLGGHQCGELASFLGCNLTHKFLLNNWENLEDSLLAEDPIQVCRLISDAILYASKEIYKTSLPNPELFGMATTLAIGLIFDGNLYIGHVGDTRLYLVRNGIVHQLTTDHTALNEYLLEYGEQNIESFKPFRNCLSKAVGMSETFVADTMVTALQSKDTIVICTDGLTKYLSSDQQLADLLSIADVQQPAHALVDFANLSGGGDNTTAIVVNVD